jgi:hypothetical protein
MARKCRPIIYDEPAGDEEIWARNFITDLMEIIQPPLNSQEARPLKRTRAGLSVEEREAREAYKLMKEEKMKEIYEFRQNYKGPTYHPVERSLWGPL